MIISREEFADIENKMNNILSDLEWKVLMSYLDGKSYQELPLNWIGTSNQLIMLCRE